MGNIYCIGRNYVEHIYELGNEVPKWPVVFSKPTHALVEAKGNQIELPNNQGEVHYETEIVLKMAADYTEDFVLEELVREMTIGLDLTLRDVQSELKAQGHPWLLAKGFPQSAIIGKWLSFNEEVCKNTAFVLEVNEREKQNGDCKKMIYPFKEMIHYIGTHLGLKKDDIIFTGTPKGVGPLHNKDVLKLYFGNKEVGNCTITM